MVSDSEEDGCDEQPQDVPSASVVLHMGWRGQASVRRWQAEIVCRDQQPEKKKAAI